MQQVYKSQTQSGKYGWFTGGYLVWPMTLEDYAKPDSWHSQQAKERGFVYVVR